MSYVDKFYKQLDPDQAWHHVGLIWIQTVWHYDDIPESIYLKKTFILKKKSEDRKKTWKITQ